jgi:alkylated DNA repair protein (DNA oxidative demethylase)
MDLFSSRESVRGEEILEAGAVVLRGFAAPYEAVLVDDLSKVVAAAPFRHMVTPGGFQMSVAMTNCGSLGWITDKRGYRYDAMDPQSGKHWPGMPASFLALAQEAASAGGFRGFVPDACLINRYQAGTRLTLHQDKNERDFRHPVVSVSLGISAVFLFGGARRTDSTIRVPLDHGDVVVWGGPARLRFHGVAAVKPGHHRLTGDHRINLTFRKAS